ncbi:MAG: electron transfer flavoprotein subunit beta/FixA family protein [Chlorobi bacterium]|nr:electron transfer flavoprotein subunit beta/FixA family protein [Chlorobiota bacterium]
MRIVVCICQVPDTAASIAVADGELDLARVSWVMNPYDEYAVEEAVRLKEQFTGSEVVVMTVTEGPARELLQKALAMGADRAVELLAPSVQDSFRIASALAVSLRERYPQTPPDLVLCGKESLDYQNGAVPGMLAALLDIAFAGPVTSLAATGEMLELQRENENGTELLHVRYPVVISAEKGLNIPRKTGIRQVMEARKKPIETISVPDIQASLLLPLGFEAVSVKKSCRFAKSAGELAGMLLQDGHISAGGG